MKDFKKLLVWQKGIELAVMCYALTKKLPEFVSFGLISQINRAAISIPLNISEGNSWINDKDNRRFLEIDLGSANELETLVILLGELEPVSNKIVKNTLLCIREKQRLLCSFIKILQNQDKPTVRS